MPNKTNLPVFSRMPVANTRREADTIFNNSTPPMPDCKMQDARGRRVNYLRLSVTDRCNFHCVYCVNQQRQQFIPHDRILRYEEFLRLIDIAAKLGARKIRITGGEPFARRGLVNFLEQIKLRHPELQLCVTTNGTLLEPYLNDLANLELASFNISIDSFIRQDFEQITGQDALPAVLNNMLGLLERGQRIKINAVAMRGLTDAQMPQFISVIRRYPVDLRFIEFMPIGGNTIWNKKKFISCNELIKIVGSAIQIKPLTANDALAGPAQMYNVENCAGRLGFISAISSHFCAQCNRVRLTSQGCLRTCLFSDHEVKMAPLLRNPKITDVQIEKAILSALLRKPFGKDLLTARNSAYVAEAQMIEIGG